MVSYLWGVSQGRENMAAALFLKRLHITAAGTLGPGALSCWCLLSPATCWTDSCYFSSLSRPQTSGQWEGSLDFTAEDPVGGFVNNKDFSIPGQW